MGYGYRADRYGPGYADERLGAAEAAGYFVVHHRSVDIPGGCSSRVHRPYEEAGPS